MEIMKDQVNKLRTLKERDPAGYAELIKSNPALARQLELVGGQTAK